MDSGIRARVGRAPKVSNLQKPRPLRATLKDISEECNNNIVNSEFNLNNAKNQNLSTLIQEEITENFKTLCLINNNTDKQTVSDSIPEQTVPTSARKKAPRGLKLTKPPPRRNSQNKSIEELEKDVLYYIEMLLLHTFTTDISVKFREFLMSHGLELEKSNKGLMDNCFACVKEYLNSSSKDTHVETDLKDMMLLRKQNWESADAVNSPKEEITCDLTEIITSSLDSIRNDENANFLPDATSTSKVATQQSVDSGYGEMDEVLWESEEQFFKDLQQHRLVATTPDKEVRFDEKESVMTDIDNGNTIISQHNRFSDSRSYRSKSEENYMNSNNLSQNYSRPFGSEESRLSTKQQTFGGSSKSVRGDEEEDWESDIILDVTPPTCFQRSVSMEEGLKKFSSDVSSQRSFGGFGSPPLVKEEKSSERKRQGFSRSVSLEEKPKSFKERFTGLTSKNMLIRDPITPGMSEDKVKVIERTLPRGIYSAGGRRAMFRRYSDAMKDDFIEDSRDHSYTRMEMLCLSESPLSKKVPCEWSYLVHIFPDICITKGNEYFKKDEYLQKAESEQIIRYVRDSTKYFGQKSDTEQNTGFGHKFGVKTDFGLIRRTIDFSI